MSDQGKKISILAPLIRGQKGTHENVFDDLKKDGFTKVRVDSKTYDLNTVKEEIKLERYEKHWIEAVIDTVPVNDDERLRISEGVDQALHIGKGRILLLDIAVAEKADKNTTKKKELERGEGETVYTTHGACSKHPEIVFEPLEPRMFSFNSPFGACNDCHGLGEILQISEELLIPDPSKSIMDGGLAIYGKMEITWRAQQIAAVGKKYGFDIFTPLGKLTKKQLNILLHGTEETITGKWHTGQEMNFTKGWEGVIPQTMRLYKQTESDWRKSDIEKFMIAKFCTTCMGKRLKDIVLSVQVGKRSIIEVTELSIDDAITFFFSLEETLNDKDRIIAKQVLKEINERLGFMKNVGLNYLSLSRAARTLSGGEAQRIRLATQIGSNLMGVLYILDEPSIGLHQRDNEKLIATLHRLRDIGNTLIVVEHDEDTIRKADYVIDMGPGAGIHGGHITAKGTVPEILQNAKSITGQYLSGNKRIEVPKQFRKPTDYIKVFGACENNLKQIDVLLPTGVLCAITGVSGSGKSTLMNQTVMPYLERNFSESTKKVGKHTKIEIPKNVHNVIIIDQDPIGRTPRSNPATYTKIFDDIRKLFASTKDARSRGYKEGRFSFNVKGGRCEACTGDGVIKIEMNFLPDVYVECSECKGRRYNKETLDILYKGKNIAEVLEMTVEEALSYFENHSSIKRKVETLIDVGLGYIKLGQASTTLSGGESQRIKITRELAKQKRGNTVYMLDEPTTGLHFEDTRKLITVLNRLVDKGNSIFVIEHNLDVIKCSDYIIDLGPEGGNGGGEIIFSGTPCEIITIKKSYTGQFLKY